MIIREQLRGKATRFRIPESASTFFGRLKSLKVNFFCYLVFFFFQLLECCLYLVFISDGIKSTEYANNSNCRVLFKRIFFRNVSEEYVCVLSESSVYENILNISVIGYCFVEFRGGSTQKT